MSEDQNINNQNNFEVPENYFQTSANSIFNKIEWQEEHKEFSKLLKYRNVEVFSVPENYFEENESHLKASAKQEKTKIIPLFSHKMWYAAAAMLIIALGFWFYGSYFNTTQKIEDCKTLACVDKNDLLKSNAFETIDNDDLYDMVNLSELEQSLNSTSQENNTSNEDFE